MFGELTYGQRLFIRVTLYGFALIGLAAIYVAADKVSDWLAGLIF